MNPILFLHISKTAGSSVKSALKVAFNNRKFCEEIFEVPLRKQINDLNFEFYAAHVGFSTARLLKADVITLLRDPVNRLNSLYNFWHNNNPKEDPGGVFNRVSSMTPLEFFQSNEMTIKVGRDNCQAYQLAWSHNKFGRDRLKGESDDNIINMALENLRQCKLVGFVEHLDKFTDDFKSEFSKEINIPKINISQKSHNNFLYDKDIRAVMFESLYLDQALYSAAIREFL